MNLTASVYTEEGSYCVVCDAQAIVGREGTYILHMEGNPFTLFKLKNKYREEIFGDTDTYLMMKDEKYFRNHTTLTDIEGLYLWKEV